ncbi:histidine phosphatase family protein [Pedomonas sp. V897]|uniref:histidine phosphatase family protein n=1 Tax=Pedomonas sp. V897 TaxID=3446482 RepID=UPI003EE01676
MTAAPSGACSPWPLWLLRHGTPVETGVLLGWTDVPLSGKGAQAAEAQAGRLAQQGIQRIITSDLTRCRETAAVVGKHLGLPVMDDVRWREVNFGLWDGMAPNALPQDSLSRFQTDPDLHPPPGGERWQDLRLRVGEALEALEPQATLIVAHGGSMRAALSILLDWPLDHCWAVDLPYGILVRLNLWETCPRTAQLTGLFRVEDGL